MAFKDPLDEEADAAEGAIVQANVRAHAARAGADDDSDEVEVQDEEEADPDVVAQPKSRSDKRAERMSARERAAAAEARAEAYKEQLEITRRNNAERPASNANPAAGFDEKLRKTYKAQEDLQSEYASREANLTASQKQEYWDKAVALDIEKNTLIAQRNDALNAPRREQEAVTAQLRRENRDVYDNPKAIQYAAGRVTQLLAQGHEDSKALHDMVMDETRQVILGRRPPPDAGQRARATGVVSRAQSMPGAAPPKISMPKGSPLYRMAVATYPDLDPDKACQKWANRNGKAYLQSTGGRR